MRMFHVELPMSPYRYIYFVRLRALVVNVCVPRSKVERVAFDRSTVSI